MRQRKFLYIRFLWICFGPYGLILKKREVRILLRMGQIDMLGLY